MRLTIGWQVCGPTSDQALVCKSILHQSVESEWRGSTTVGGANPGWWTFCRCETTAPANLGIRKGRYIPAISIALNCSASLAPGEAARSRRLRSRTRTVLHMHKVHNCCPGKRSLRTRSSQ
eukprot:533003-Pyramimonas_sp.AAC.2